VIISQKILSLPSRVSSPSRRKLRRMERRREGGKTSQKEEERITKL